MKYEVMQDCNFNEISKTTQRKVGDIVESDREDVYVKVLVDKGILKPIKEVEEL